MTEILTITKGKRSLRTTLARKRHDNIIKVPRDLLIDLKTSMHSDLGHIATKRMPELSEMAIKILYLFEERFIKREWRTSRRVKSMKWFDNHCELIHN